ncbi:MAG: rhomboid family intramembrane serine protease [Terriglobia bacterium]
MSEQQMRSNNQPIATLYVLSITGIVTGLQFGFPQLLPCLERTPSAFAQHQWWRLVTPLFVHDEGWRQIAFNFLSILIVGILAERLWGSRRWLVLYFASGLIGELAGYAWKPLGAGASVAGAGLLGSLAPGSLYKGKLMRARFGGAVILLAAAVLLFSHDLHGPPILAGACLASAMFKAEASKRVTSNSHQEM